MTSPDLTSPIILTDPVNTPSQPSLPAVGEFMTFAVQVTPFKTQSLSFTFNYSLPSPASARLQLLSLYGFGVLPSTVTNIAITSDSKRLYYVQSASNKLSVKPEGGRARTLAASSLDPRTLRRGFSLYTNGSELVVGLGKDAIRDMSEDGDEAADPPDKDGKVWHKYYTYDLGSCEEVRECGREMTTS